MEIKSESFPKKITLESFEDPRGKLTPLKFSECLGFLPVRIFYLTEAGAEVVRGDHAHRNCTQAIQCINGKVQVSVHDGSKIERIILQNVQEVFLIPPMHWVSLKMISPETKIAVFASHDYEESEYIRNFQEFLELSKNALFDGV